MLVVGGNEVGRDSERRRIRGMRGIEGGKGLK